MACSGCVMVSGHYCCLGVDGGVVGIVRVSGVVILVMVTVVLSSRPFHLIYKESSHGCWIICKEKIGKCPFILRLYIEV